MSNVSVKDLEINLLSKQSIANAHGSAVLKITPEVAAYWLNRLNKANRPLVENHAKELSRRMKDGQWKLNGETIKFDDQGNMLDGQHRCRAIVLLGSSIDVECRFGLGDVFETLDEGKKRSPSDALSVRGVANYTNVAASISFILRHRLKRNNHGEGAKVSNRDVLDFYYEHEDEISSYVQIAAKWYEVSARILPPSEFAAYLFLFSEKHVDDAKKFLNSLAVGSNLSRNSPIFKLRAKLMQSRYDRQKSLTPAVKKGLIIKAWNFYRKGKEVKQFKFDIERESYPEII